MIEEWKVIKEWNGVTNKNSTHCSGDRIYVSNTGKVKLNDIELTLDRGLYINKDYEICIVGTSWPFGNMYRTIYQLFTGKLKKGYGWNIHHIDGNHYNNSLDNLLQVSAFEHGKIHAEHDIDWGDNNPRNIDWVKQQQARRVEVIKETKEWLKQRVNDYLNDDSRMLAYKDRLQKQKEETTIKQEEYKKKKNKEREDKLNSGDYTLASDGRVVPKTTAKKGYVMSEEEKEKHRIANKQVYIDRPELRDKCRGTKGKHRHFNEETKKYFYK